MRKLVTFLDSSHFDRHTFFPRTSNFQKLLSSLIHFVRENPWNIWDSYCILPRTCSHTLSLSQGGDVALHSTTLLPPPLACAHLSMPLLKCKAQDSTPDLFCLWEHTADLLHPLNETPGSLKPCHRLKYLGLKPGLPPCFRTFEFFVVNCLLNPTLLLWDYYPNLLRSFRIFLFAI